MPLTAEHTDYPIVMRIVGPRRSTNIRDVEPIPERDAYLVTFEDETTQEITGLQITKEAVKTPRGATVRAPGRPRISEAITDPRFLTVQLQIGMPWWRRKQIQDLAASMGAYPSTLVNEALERVIPSEPPPE